MKKIVPKDVVLIPESAERVFEGQIFDVHQWPQKMFDGSTETFEMLRRPDTMIVIGVVDDKILVVEDEQPHQGAKLGFPAGRAELSDESTLESAKREALEETGYEFSDWRLVEVIQRHKKIEWFTYYYLATGGEKTSEQKLDAGEKISVKLVGLNELKKMIESKQGYLGYVADIFEKVNSIDDLKALPVYEGQEVDL